MWKTKAITLVALAGVFYSENSWAECSVGNMPVGDYQCLDVCSSVATQVPRVDDLGGGVYRFTNDVGNPTTASGPAPDLLTLDVRPASGWDGMKAHLSGVQHCIISFDNKSLWMHQ
jgi:hypothetical protein